VVAEGIEQAGQRGTLQSLGCVLGQGYLFARPMPMADFVAFAVANRRVEV
jgi:EAL domain-containing protein (putative c-di-GMP-specific phosphodiesterase class I)